MTDRKNKGKYEVCQDCGAHLDHGERCDCQDEEKKASAEGEIRYWSGGRKTAEILN